MSATLEKAREIAANLTDVEKRELADYLWTSLARKHEIDESLYGELDAIEADMIAGKDPGIPWKEFAGQLRKNLNLS